MNEYISVLLLAGGNGCPNTFAPGHASVTTSPLDDASINDRVTDFTFGAVIGRFHKWVRHIDAVLVCQAMIMAIFHRCPQGQVGHLSF